MLFQSASGAIKRLLPLFDRVLIRKAEALTKTKGGIVIPEKAQAKVLEGTVVAVGPGSRTQVTNTVENFDPFVTSIALFRKE